jgi:hypothetical protein
VECLCLRCTALGLSEANRIHRNVGIALLVQARGHPMTKALLFYAVAFLIVSSRLGWEAMLLSLVAFVVGVGGGGAWADESSDDLPRVKF